MFSSGFAHVESEVSKPDWYQWLILKGFRGVRFGTPFETKIFNFHGDFSEKSGNIDK